MVLNIEVLNFAALFTEQINILLLKLMKKVFIVLTVAKLGDLIQFVQYYFNLNFKQAMEKINIDFGLNLDSNVKLDYDKIKEIINQRNQKKRHLEILEKRFVELCDFKFQLKTQIETKKVILSSWEDDVFDISIMQDKIGKIDMVLDELIENMNAIKNS